MRRGQWGRRRGDARHGAPDRLPAMPEDQAASGSFGRGDPPCRAMVTGTSWRRHRGLPNVASRSPPSPFQAAGGPKHASLWLAQVLIPRWWVRAGTAHAHGRFLDSAGAGSYTLSVLRGLGGGESEAHLSAQATPPSPGPRFPAAHAVAGRPPRHQGASSQGPQAPRSLVRRPPVRSLSTFATARCSSEWCGKDGHRPIACVRCMCGRAAMARRRGWGLQRGGA